MSSSGHQTHTQSLEATPSAASLNQHPLPSKQSSLFPQFTWLFDDSSPTAVFFFFWVNECSILQSALPQSFTPQTGPKGLLFHDSLLNPFPIDEAAILRLPAGVALEHQAQRRNLNSTEHTVGLNAYLSDE